MKKSLLVLLSFSLISVLAGAQEQPQANDAEKLTARRTYKVNFLMYEQQEGKRINERTYTMPITLDHNGSGDSSIQVGDRVPIYVSKESFQYIDIGLNIDGKLTEQGDKLVLTSTLVLSSIVSEEGAGAHGSGADPVVRQIKQRFTSMIMSGKPTLVTSIDDINSKKRMQVEVTATRVE